MGDIAENIPEEEINETLEQEVDGQPETEEPEFFLEGEDETHKSNDSVPVAAHVHLKKKLKGELKEKDQNIDALKQELELYKLKEKQQQSASQDAPLQFPQRKDFDYDDDAYEAAVQDYQVKFQARIDEANKKVLEEATNQVNEIKQGETLRQRESKFDEALEKSVKQAEEYGLKDYDEAATSVAQAMPEGAYEILLTSGVVDAKTTYYLHKNPGKLQEIIGIANTLGDHAAVSKLTEIRLGLKTRQHQSPPDPDLPTTGAKGAGSNNFQLAIDKERNKPAHEIDMQKIIQLKRQAREAGVEIY